MANLNEIKIMGQLGQDVELNYISKTTAVINLSIATSDEYLDKNSKKQKKTEWHKVSYFGKHAEVLVKQLKIGKGDSVYISGKMQYGSYEKDGVEIPTATIKADTVQLLVSKSKD